MFESISKLEPDRKCWRLVNGVLFEKPNKDVQPELKQMVNNLNAVIKQLQEGIAQKKQEAAQLELAYDSIMKQAKARQAE